MYSLLIISGNVELNPGPNNGKFCKYLNICHINIRSLTRSKLLAMKTTLIDTYDVITLSETYLHIGVGDDVFALQGYHDIIRRDRDGLGGGVAVYVKESLIYKRIYELESIDVEAIWLQLNTIQGKILICCCYRPPTDIAFWENFDSVLDNVSYHETKYVFVLGDLNADFHTPNGTKLVDLCSRYNMSCLITEPTRITATTSTTLDQIITNAPNFIGNVSVAPPLSTNDHCTVSALLNFKVKKEAPYHRTIWQYNRADFTEFRRCLINTDFDACFANDDIDIVNSQWTETFLNVARTTIPNKVITVRPNDTPWYSNELRVFKRKVQRFYQKFKKNKNEIRWEAYRKARNEYQSKLDKAEIEYKLSLSESLSESRNSKSWWKTVKNLLGKGGDTSYPSLNLNNAMITDNHEKAQAFNTFFLSHSNIDLSSAQLPETDDVPARLVDIQTTEQEVSDLIKCIDTTKATGPDGISPKLLHEAGDAIVPSLTKLLNLSLSSAKIPLCWKTANVLPLFKKGDKTDINNYRPVSLLSSVSKILERVVFKHTYNYIKDNALISSNQSGFKPGDSTVNQLTFLYHTFCEALDNKKDVKVVFCDISKAFDRVWHDGLLFKMKKFGINGNILKWFKDYLYDRHQRVIIRGQASDLGLIKAGVPQGSVLGPLLFLIYINDIADLTKCNIKLFADDTILYINVDDPIDAVNSLNTDLKCIEEWADQWLITFSPAKTKLMTCSFKKVDYQPVIFSTKQLTDVVNHKHLGLTLSNNLSWTAHIKNLLANVTSMSNVLKKLKYDIDRRSIETIYFTFIRPKLEYASHIWDNCANKDSELLEKFQLDMARTVTGARKGTSHDLLYKETNWKPLADRRKAVKLKNFIKIINHQTPPYLETIIPAKIGSVRPMSRSAHNYYTPKTRTETFKRSFIPTAVKHYNELDETNRNVDYTKKLLDSITNDLMNFGKRRVNVKHAQLRMKCSKLNYHLFLLHVTDSPQCMCGHESEDSSHFLLHCPLFMVQRQKMFHCLQPIIHNFNENTLMFGSDNLSLSQNKNLFAVVHTYIEESERL